MRAACLSACARMCMCIVCVCVLCVLCMYVCVCARVFLGQAARQTPTRDLAWQSLKYNNFEIAHD